MTTVHLRLDEYIRFCYNGTDVWNINAGTASQKKGAGDHVREHGKSIR